jgi:diacylglycerol kinase
MRKSTSPAKSAILEQPARGYPAPAPRDQLQPLNYHTHYGFVPGRLRSFTAALAGVAYTVRTQPNTWIELAAVLCVTVAGFWFGISRLEWALIVLTFALVLAMEAVNTAVESVVDLVSPQFHPLAKVAKDTAAGAMIFAVLGSIGVAGLIFGPRIWQLFFA